MLVCMLAVGAAPLAAQATGSISGTVTNAVTDRPLAGVRILVMGSTLQGVTDNGGNYLIRQVPVGSHTLRVLSVGYNRVETTVSVTLGQDFTADFGMQPTAISLDEIVVTGTAGRQEKRTLGNSVEIVQVGSLVEDAPIHNVTELLTARAPGLTLLSNSGQAGSSSNVRIRGAGSMNGGYTPIFYVDGIRIYSHPERGQPSSKIREVSLEAQKARAELRDHIIDDIWALLDELGSRRSGRSDTTRRDA